MNDPNRFKFDGDQFYVKTGEEMARVFDGAPQGAPERSVAIAERCNFKLDKVGDRPFPQFEVPDGHTIEKLSTSTFAVKEFSAKRLETSIGFLQRGGRLKKPLFEYEERLEREIACIKQMKFSGYFLIVWDFIRYAKENLIPVGPGRGSAAGSLVSAQQWRSPISTRFQNELLFERFLNPERVSMPDIDVDFCMNRRGEVINYVC